MDLKNFSLLYPDEDSRRMHLNSHDRPDISQYVADELGFSEIMELKNGSISDFFTADPRVIEYRNETFDDLLNNPGLIDTLNAVMPILNDILELRRLESDSGETTDYLASITEIELYISSVDTLNDGLNAVSDKLKGRAFKTLCDRINELAESDYYSELNEKLYELTKRVREIRSVTVGVNLDAQLRPKDAGVLAINPEPFRSGDVIEKILRLNFKDDEYTCIAKLVPFNKNQTENQRTALSIAFNSAINEVYSSSLRSWKKIVQQYVLENTDFLLDLIPEIEFLVKGTRMLSRLKSKGCSLCVPEIMPSEDRAYRAYGLYNPVVALKIEDEVVTNDLIFDENAAIYVLSGPNRGGKSVITCALGISQAMLQLGMFITAESAVMSPVDAVFTHFPTGADDTIDKGRLGEECARLDAIINSATSRSLVLLDESLSSTGAFEASYIAAEVLGGFALIGCRVLFSTHLHELAGMIDDINARTAGRGVRIDTLVAGIEEGKRSFKITRAKPDGKSYARDIAEKYGLSFEAISKKVNGDRAERK